MSQPNVTRPPLKAALAAWQECLATAGFPSESLWIFPENLCIEQSTTDPDDMRVSFQTKFTPPDDDALEIAWDVFSETKSRIVFYRLGSTGNKSVCILLCDAWLEKRSQSNGFIRRDEWNVSFRLGPADSIEEVTDLGRWVRRVKRGRELRDYDFGMALATIDEIKLHGRPLLPYERMADKMMNNLRRKVSAD
jgi:hypothetical protein